MRRPGGYAQIIDPDRPLVERDTITCGHCGQLVFVKPGTVATVYLVYHRSLARWEEHDGAGCFLCSKSICLACYALGRCLPLEAQLATLEGRPERKIYAVSSGF